MLGYCVICQTKCELRDLKQIQRSGLPAVEGTCTACGTKTFLLGAEVPTPEDAPSPE